jgi:hypothetical protein
MFFNLTTNKHHPLLGMIRAIFGLREVGLKTKNFVLGFASDDIDTLLCVGLHTGNASVHVHFGAFDTLIGFTLDLVGSACRLSQLTL